jgi:hypothetical protein
MQVLEPRVAARRCAAQRDPLRLRAEPAAAGRAAGAAPGAGGARRAAAGDAGGAARGGGVDALQAYPRVVGRRVKVQEQQQGLGRLADLRRRRGGNPRRRGARWGREERRVGRWRPTASWQGSARAASQQAAGGFAVPKSHTAARSRLGRAPTSAAP